MSKSRNKIKFNKNQINNKRKSADGHSELREISFLEKNINKEIKKKRRIENRLRRSENIKRIKTHVKEKTNKVVEKSWTWLHKLGAGFWFLLIFIGLIIMAFFLHLEEWVINMVLAHGLIGIFILSFVSELLILPVGPDIPLIVAVMFLKSNHWLVLLIVLLASWSSLLIAYFVGKNLGEPGIQRIIGRKKWSKIESNDKYGKWLVFLGAISPVPYIPYLTGLFKMNFKEVILYVVLPRGFRFLLVTLGSIFLGGLMVKLFF